MKQRKHLQRLIKPPHDITYVWDELRRLMSVGRCCVVWLVLCSSRDQDSPWNDHVYDVSFAFGEQSRDQDSKGARHHRQCRQRSVDLQVRGPNLASDTANYVLACFLLDNKLAQ